jgi:hypothetical protein
MLEQDAANPAPPDEEIPLEEAENPDEVDTVNDNASGISEGDGEAEDEEAVPNPNPQASAEAQPAVQLPDGLQSVEQLIQAYNTLKAGSGDVAALRDMNAQLVSIAEALGYGQDMNSVDLSALDESTPEGAARAEAHRIFQPLLEQQQKHVRQQLIDRANARFRQEHTDAEEMMDEIRAIMEGDEGLMGSESGMEAAYHLARSKRYRPESAMLEDEAFIQRAAQNPKIQERVIEDYLKQVAKGGEGAVKGISSAGSTASSGKKKAPMTMAEANRAARKLFGG